MTVSIIVPTYQMRVSLGELLNSLSKQTDSEFEVVLVDNDSSAQSKAFLEDLIDNYSTLKVQLFIPGENLGAGGGRNFGAKKCTSSILAFIDDDCLAKENWVEVIKENFASDQNQIIFGPVSSQVHPIPPFIHGFDMKGDVFGSGNCAIRASFFEKLGGFDTYLNNWAEDFEIGARCEKLNSPPKFIPEMVVVHPPKLMKYSISGQVLRQAFYKKFIYITKYKNYEYKNEFNHSFISKGRKKIAVFIVAISLSYFSSYFLFFPFLILPLFQTRRYFQVLAATKSYQFENRFDHFNFFKFAFFSWIVDIINMFQIIRFQSKKAEEKILTTVKADLEGRESGD